MSPDVLTLLSVMFSRQVLAATDPDIEQTAALYAKTRRELLAALEATKEEGE